MLWEADTLVLFYKTLPDHLQLHPARANRRPGGSGRRGRLGERDGDVRAWSDGRNRQGEAVHRRRIRTEETGDGQNTLDFSGKVALVTGAAAGMGLATARAFAEAGAAVVLADFKEDAVKAAAAELVAAGHKAIAVRCDVSDDDQVAAMVDRTVAEFGRLDAAFNNAGVMARIAPTAESTREEWDRVIGVNLRGVWSCMKHELRQMERQGERGHRQQRLGRGVDRQPRHRLLHRLQARRGRPDADGGPRVRQARHPGERGQSRPHRHAGRPRRRRRETRRRTPRSRRTSPSAVRAGPRRSPRPCSGCAARGRATSSATPSPSTAG